jgi:hypothetical protein
LLITLLKLFSDYGVVGIITLFLGYALFIYGKHRLFPKLLNKVNGVSPAAIATNIDVSTNLSYHSLFANINHRLNNEIPSLDLLPSKPVKQQMFRDILSIYVKTLFKTCKDMAETPMNDWSSDKWCDEIIRKLNSNMYTFIDACKDAGVPDIVMTKFVRWHRPTQDILFDGIMSLGSSNIFNSNIARANTLFFMLNLLLVTTIADAEKTLKELNGEVHGKIYNGKVIEE